MDASPAHLACGFWGLMASGTPPPLQQIIMGVSESVYESFIRLGLLATQANVREVYGDDQGHHYGLFLGVTVNSSTPMMMLLINFLYVLCFIIHPLQREGLGG